MSFFEDSRRTLWAASFNGLYSLSPTTGKLKHHAHRPGATNTISKGVIKSIAEDAQGYLWFGSRGNGVNRYDPKAKVFRLFSEKHGLADNSVNVILSHKDHPTHDIWMVTEKGLSRYRPNDGSFQNYFQRHGLAGKTFPKAASIMTSTGELVIGSTEGLTIVHPDDIFTNTAIPNVVLTHFQIANKPVTINSPNSPLDKSITYTQALTLTHEHTVFSFKFTALNYRLPEENQYAYRLKGFDTQWHNIGTRRTVTYTNLDPGDYVFHVKASNNEGIWNEKGVSLSLRILPPWWLSGWAKTCYLLCFIAVLWLAIYTYIQNKRAHDEHQLVNRLREVDKMKDTFLANTSHELRTPLNGIIGLSEALIEGAGGPPSKITMENLQLIVGSGKRLAYLINDILDFSRLKEKSIQLKHSAVDLYILTQNIIYLTQPLVDTKPVKLINNIDKYQSSVMADENRLQQIMYNLVGNAIKFTEQGSISISSHTQGSSLWIDIVDTGRGIGEDQLKKVFEAFEQDQTQESFGGTGLGLAVTKQLVNLHGGDIEIESTLNQGTTVRFSLSKSDQSLMDIDKQDTSIDEAPLENEESLEDEESLQNDEPENEAHSANADYHILIVDDEPVNRRVLVNLLALKSYRTSECSSGYQALERLNAQKEANNGESIDLILLDVMMPSLNGYQTCKEIRKTYSVNQLPVLFLTAKTQVSDLEEGYICGGNDYLTKPISKRELFARIKTHLKLLNRHRSIEKEVQFRTQQLTRSHERMELTNDCLKQTQARLAQSEKMSALVSLLAKFEQDIHTPISSVNSSTYYVTHHLMEFQKFLNTIVDETDEEVIEALDHRFNQLFEQLSLAHDGNQRIHKLVTHLHTSSSGDADEEE